MIGSNISTPFYLFINQDEEDSELDEEEGDGEEEEEKIDRKWSVLKTTPQPRKSKVL